MTTRERDAETTSVAGLLLAAGEGSRLGRPKALVELEGERLVDRGARILREGGCDPVYVVTGAADVTVEAAVTIHNPDWADGMGSSLRMGLATLPPGVDAVVVALADQPLVTPAAIGRLLGAYREGARAAVATYSGNLRNPVLLGREHWPSVHALAEGDVGARHFLRAYSHLVTMVACDDVARPDDIDTPEDLDRMRALLASGENRP
ncbi:nucleotidyltransferase family protein [Marinactinospora thermotolerans]|uniref:Nicotine blue oxidoreductase n=1 Tax=Marinactinospora thermotolerans DSM 45154 TaxID=1122192 RepID=A0A1T4KXF4_9ACTN|nr:nucleotidyltransferase family protein [Marinactinospora thermotolerans]SJZ47119.1 nicotine blue oxidoreductase [Marinactinospora thermotolerans DSM 45154]